MECSRLEAKLLCLERCEAVNKAHRYGRCLDFAFTCGRSHVEKVRKEDKIEQTTQVNNELNKMLM